MTSKYEHQQTPDIWFDYIVCLDLLAPLSYDRQRNHADVGANGER